MVETSAQSATRYLDPAALAKLKNLGIAARLVVEGLYAGQHRSPHRGYSIEFAEHREYTPGVDPRHLDWKILGKRDKLYVKQYEEQTNLRCYLLLDSSASMSYRHDGAITKFEYACYCAASLAYLMQSQHDAFGLITYDQKVATHIPPRQGRNHLRVVLEELGKAQPVGQTDLTTTFNELAETMKRRALVVVLSDLFSVGEVGKLLESISHLRHKKHEVVVFHVLDRAELTFPFDDVTQIEDIETTRLVSANASSMRNEYLRRLNEFIDSMRSGCQSRGVGYALADTSQPFDLFLGNYLSHRLRLAAKR
ncbi:MAG: DUF58 domain-containing protein [Phycisphaeraceae bacterium]|nr:DUF58 domain-containing protein [Phycisphaeraceae bacterium]